MFVGVGVGVGGVGTYAVIVEQARLHTVSKAPVVATPSAAAAAARHKWGCHNQRLLHVQGMQHAAHISFLARTGGATPMPTAPPLSCACVMLGAGAWGDEGLACCAILGWTGP